jgi:hypothetical protein
MCVDRPRPSFAAAGMGGAAVPKADYIEALRLLFPAKTAMDLGAIRHAVEGSCSGDSVPESKLARLEQQVDVYCLSWMIAPLPVGAWSAGSRVCVACEWSWRQPLGGGGSTLPRLKGVPGMLKHCSPCHSSHVGWHAQHRPLAICRP